MNEAQIQSLFDSIAEKYDLTNDFLSFGLHRLWNRRFIASLPQSAPAILDLCCGTGELTLRYESPHSHYTLLDFSHEMLEIARFRLEKTTKKHTIVQGNAKSLPFRDASFDLVMVSYGVRNIDDTKKCFEEVRRVLKPGGTFAILELTRPQNRILRFLHSFYLKALVPQMGRVITSNKDAYQHLKESITTFMDADKVLQELNETGFTTKAKRSYHGGIASALICTN